MKTEISQPVTSRIPIRAGDRFLLMGDSGSGKTTAAKLLDRHLARLYPTHRHYILDSKHDGDFDRYPNIIASDRAPEKPKSNQRYQIWQPIIEDPEEIEKWLFMVRRDAPAYLLVDELYTLVYGKNAYSRQYTILQKTGRSLPVGCITCTQELSKIPSNAYKQAVHRFGFYIDQAAEYDRRIRNSLLKSKGLSDPEHEFGFWYQSRSGRGEPNYYENIQQFLHL